MELIYSIKTDLFNYRSYIFSKIVQAFQCLQNHTQTSYIPDKSEDQASESFSVQFNSCIIKLSNHISKNIFPDDSNIVNQIIHGLAVLPLYCNLIDKQVKFPVYFVDLCLD